MDRIPFIVFGDGPRLATGLARIALDLTIRLWATEEDLGIRVLQLGVDEPEGWHSRHGWDVYGFQPTMQNFGRNALQRVCLELREAGASKPIVLAITDPSRVWDLVRPPLFSDLYPLETPDITLWGYYPVDAENPTGAIGGPAAVTVQKTDRLLAYTGYGARVLRRTLMQQNPDTTTIGAVQHLPHGIDTATFCPRPFSEADDLFRDWCPMEGALIGCVATNQPRKDFGLLFAAVAEVARTRMAALWIHTDLITGRAWDLGELARQSGLTKAQVLVSTGYLPDVQLAARYSASHLTIAPGLGEGFGYPIVESQSCGCPVIAIDYAGGAELVPNRFWLQEAEAWRIESVYALVRPVVNPTSLAARIGVVLSDVESRYQELRAYCRGAVSYLDWRVVWPRWQTWVRKGLEHERRRRETAAELAAHPEPDPGPGGAGASGGRPGGRGAGDGGPDPVPDLRGARLPGAGAPSPGGDSGADQGDADLPGAGQGARDRSVE